MKSFLEPISVLFKGAVAFALYTCLSMTLLYWYLSGPGPELITDHPLIGQCFETTEELTLYQVEDGHIGEDVAKLMDSQGGDYFAFSSPPINPINQVVLPKGEPVQLVHIIFHENRVAGISNYYYLETQGAGAKVRRYYFRTAGDCAEPMECMQVTTAYRRLAQCLHIY